MTLSQRKALRWVGMDLDGTLFRNDWSPENTTAEIGKPIHENLYELSRLVRAGYKIIIHTSRPWGDHEAIAERLDSLDIPYSQIVCGKLMAAAYIDDRAIRADSTDWLGQVDKINGLA